MVTLDKGVGGWYSPVMSQGVHVLDAFVAEDGSGVYFCVGRERGNGNLTRYHHEVDEEGYLWLIVPAVEFIGQIGNVQGGWRESKKYKDRDGNWITRTAWGSGKAGW